MRDWGGELGEGAFGGWVMLWKGKPGVAVVDVGDACRGADGEEAVWAKRERLGSRSGVLGVTSATEGDDGGAYGAFVDPSSDDFFLPAVPFYGFSALAYCYQALAIAPPCEIRDAASSFDAHCCYPLTSSRVKDLYTPTSLFAGADDAHVSSAGRELEALERSHVCRFFLGACPQGVGHFFDFPRREVPDVEVATSTGAVDLIARRVEECGRG